MTQQLSTATFYNDFWSIYNWYLNNIRVKSHNNILLFRFHFIIFVRKIFNFFQKTFFIVLNNFLNHRRIVFCIKKVLTKKSTKYFRKRKRIINIVRAHPNQYFISKVHDLTSMISFRQIQFLWSPKTFVSVSMQILSMQIVFDF